MVNLLVFCNHFMRHIMAYMIPNQTAKTITKFLWQGYILIFGTLAKLLSDWGANFENNIIKDLCELIGIQKVRTSLYHALTSGQVEWAHQRLMCMIGKLRSWVRTGRQIGPNIYQTWYMLTAPQHWQSLDTAHITWCPGTFHNYPSTFSSPW